MNNPVAYRHWMIDEEFPENSCWEYFDAPTGEDCKECESLYINPHKQLNDEEIDMFAYAFELWLLNNPDKTLEGIKDFAKTIIKKLND